MPESLANFGRDAPPPTAIILPPARFIGFRFFLTGFGPVFGLDPVFGPGPDFDPGPLFGPSESSFWDDFAAIRYLIINPLNLPCDALMFESNFKKILLPRDTNGTGF